MNWLQFATFTFMFHYVTYYLPGNMDFGWQSMSFHHCMLWVNYPKYFMLSLYTWNSFEGVIFQLRLRAKFNIQALYFGPYPANGYTLYANPGCQRCTSKHQKIWCLLGLLDWSAHQYI